MNTPPQHPAGTMRPLGRRTALSMLLLTGLSACFDIAGGGPGPVVNTRAAVPVALLVPRGSEDPNNDALAESLENAARLAAEDLGQVRIDLRIYDTAASSQTAAEMARKAVAEGARIIVGPVYADAANAAGGAVAGRGIPVLSFSNNTEIAGGNIYVLGHTFQNTANRLLTYAAAQGRQTVMVVHADNLTGQVGRKAVERAAARAGMTFAGGASYEFSQQGVIDAIRPIAEQVLETGTDTLVFAADTAGALPILAQLLPENGVSPEEVKFVGLTRWDIPTQTLSLRGLQGGWFALPDPDLDTAFRTRYTLAYGKPPHPLAGIAYDAVAMIGSLIEQGGATPFSAARLTQPAGFAGVNGVFRLLPDGTNERALAVVEIVNNKVQVIDPAPRSFSAAAL